MKKITNILLFIFLIPIVLSSQDCDLSIGLKLETNSGSNFDLIKLGINNNATDDLDTDLGENDWFGWPPGTELHAFLRFYDKPTESFVVSYEDYKSIPDSMKFHRRFHLLVRFENDDTLKISWDKFGDCIDSAKIIDTFDDEFVNLEANMLEEDKLIVGNSSINEFYIDIWFNKNVSSILENSNFSPKIFPVPFSDNLNIDDIDISTVSIFDVNGIELISTQKSQIDTRNLPLGLYFIIINAVDGKQYSYKIVKVQN